MSLDIGLARGRITRALRAFEIGVGPLAGRVDRLRLGREPGRWRDRLTMNPHTTHASHAGRSSSVASGSTSRRAPAVVPPALAGRVRSALSRAAQGARPTTGRPARSFLSSFDGSWSGSPLEARFQAERPSRPRPGRGRSPVRRSASRSRSASCVMTRSKAVALSVRGRGPCFGEPRRPGRTASPVACAGSLRAFSRGPTAVG